MEIIGDSMDGKIRYVLVFILIGFLLFTTVFVSGCAESGSNIKSAEDVGEAVEDISTGVGDLGSALDELDKTLG